jgi:hypothetical protein
MVAIVVATALTLTFSGLSYYLLPLDQRYFHADHEQLKPSGFLGHGLGILGTLFIVIGVFTYIGRKRLKIFSRIGILKYWLEFHIFLCVLGPLLVLYHTAFKFGGIISIGFWSMMAVVASGVIGRFIYLQIPRSIQGRMLTLQELEGMKQELNEKLKQKHQLGQSFFNLMTETLSKHYDEGFRHWAANYRDEKNYIKQLYNEVMVSGLTKPEQKEVISLFKSQISLNRRIRRLSTMHRYFRNWHIIHLPFALIMLVIISIHIGVALFFGYKWIF